MTINVRQTHRAAYKGHLARVRSDLWQSQKVGAQLLGCGYIASGQSLQEG